MAAQKKENGDEIQVVSIRKDRITFHVMRHHAADPASHFRESSA